VCSSDLEIEAELELIYEQLLELELSLILVPLVELEADTKDSESNSDGALRYKAFMVVSLFDSCCRSTEKRSIRKIISVSQ
jgi:hypothetical protein